MQNWKKVANSLKLRIALRAHGGVGEDFSDNAITEAISSGVLADEDAMFEGYADETNIWGGSSSYGDVWNNFTGSQWKTTEALINILKTLIFNEPTVISIKNFSFNFHDYDYVTLTIFCITFIVIKNIFNLFYFFCF